MPVPLFRKVALARPVGNPKLLTYQILTNVDVVRVSSRLVSSISSILLAVLKCPYFLGFKDFEEMKQN